jgi:hypothetical protein
MRSTIGVLGVAAAASLAVCGVVGVPALATSAPSAPVPDIIGACPSRALTPPGPRGAKLKLAQRSAERYARTVLHWPDVQVTHTYRIGTSGISYDSMYRYQISRSCGAATARSSYGVDLASPLGDSSTRSRAALVVGHFVDGWQVWARYYN